jgi:iron complex transport system substrate-binding protein
MPRAGLRPAEGSVGAAPAPSDWQVLGACIAQSCRRTRFAVPALAALLLASPANAAITVTDDSGRTVTLAQPARRVVALAPHITEQLYAVGAGERVVGTTDHADHPPAARKIPRVARAHSIDLERVAALQPDLIVVWGSGFPPTLLEALRRLGPPVYVNEPGALDSIATSMQRLGRLTAAPQAEDAARAFRQRITELRERHAGRTPVRVFYQVWQQPLMTLSGRHVLTEAIALCGGRNVFADLAPVAPQVSIEAVLAADPQLIATAEPDARASDALDPWRRHAALSATRLGQFATLDANTLNRHSPRMAEAIGTLCERIENARQAVARDRPR